jgi:hypothetical protein
MEGSCKEGADCKYSHDDPDNNVAMLSPAMDVAADPTTPKPGVTMTEKSTAPGWKEDRRHSLPHPLPLPVSGERDVNSDCVVTPRTVKTRPISMSSPTSPRMDISRVSAKLLPEI